MPNIVMTDNFRFGAMSLHSLVQRDRCDRAAEAEAAEQDTGEEGEQVHHQQTWMLQVPDT